MVISSTVPPQFIRWPIVDYLATRFHYLSHEAWHAWVVAGKVQRNGVVCTAETIITAGDLIACELPDWEQPEANLDYHIIYEDDWLLGIDKPPNLRVHSGGRFLKMNLMYQLKYEHHPAYPQAELCNRLDADTSGVVLVGKSRQVVRHMGELFAQRTVQKQYLAIVVGVPTVPQQIIELPIGKVPHTKVRFGVGTDVEKARPATTRYQLLETFAGCALLQVWPETGRTHQIRVHLAAIGHPILGDKLYRSASEEQFLDWCRHPHRAADAALLSRQALHCAEMAFHHPLTDTPCHIHAPLARDMAQLLVRLRQTGG